MASALFLWRTIRSPAFPQAGDFKASPRQGNDPQGHARGRDRPAQRTWSIRWLHPRPLTGLPLMRIECAAAAILVHPAARQVLQDRLMAYKMWP
jgi:hypothetical protein